MNDDVSKKAHNSINVGFQSVHIQAAQNITIKRGIYVKCNAAFTVTDGVLYVLSQYNGITLALPNVELETVEIYSAYGSIKCDGLACHQLSISSAHKVKIENSSVNECEISSKYDSVSILKSTIDTLIISAAHNVNVELDDFSYLEIGSAYDGVKVQYNGNQLVNIDCATAHGSIKTNGPFYGDTDSDKKIVISAAQSIMLLGKQK